MILLVFRIDVSRRSHPVDVLADFAVLSCNALICVILQRIDEDAFAIFNLDRRVR